MSRVARVWVIGLTLGTAAGCVSQARYDRVVEQLNTIRIDLDVAKAEELAITQEATRLESLKREARTDMIAASTALERAEEAADAERHTADAQFATLQRIVNQLNAQLLTLRDRLTEAKGDTIALNEIVAAYRRKVRTEVETAVLAQAPLSAVEQAPVSPDLAAFPQAGATPDTTSAQPPQLVRPLPDEQPPQEVQPAEPPEGGLFSTILEWLTSLWESLLSLWRGIFP